MTTWVTPSASQYITPTTGQYVTPSASQWQPQGVLDTVPNASIAYGLRRLSIITSNKCIRVCRSIDNAELDIGFDDYWGIDKSALLAFCAGGNGYVTTWYDQSGNNYHMSQPILNQQPEIVLNGIYNENGILFDGVNDLLRTDHVGALALTKNIPGLTMNAVYQHLGYATGERYVFIVHRGNFADHRSRAIIERANLSHTSGGRRLDSDSFAASGLFTLDLNVTNGHTLLINYANRKCYHYMDGRLMVQNDAFQLAGNTSDTNNSGISVGGSPYIGSVFANFYIKEAILYSAVLNDDLRSKLDLNQKKHYGF